MELNELYKSRVIDNRTFLLEDVLKHLLTSNENNSLNIAVGYFYASGLLLLKEELEEFMDTKNGSIRIIMGNETSKDTATILAGNTSTEEYLRQIPQLLTHDIESIEEDQFLEKIHKWILEDRINIKVYTGKANYFHAKTYLFYNNESTHKGDSITGSSNFSKNGLRGNTELNVLGNDNFPALFEWFDLLWHSDEVSPYSMDLLKIIEEQKPSLKSYIDYQTVQESYYDFANLYSKPTIKVENNTEWFQNLYEHQKSGIAHISNKLQTFGTAVLSDGVGLGKTRTAAAVLKSRIDNKPNINVLIIADKKLHVQWQEELAIVGIAPSLYTITNRETFSNLSYEKLTEYCQTYHFIIIDEVHQGFKNRDTQSYRKAKFLKENGHESLEALLLTATPWNNSRNDVLNIGSLFLNTITIPNDRLYKQYFLYGNDGKVINALALDDKAFDGFWEDIYLQRTRKTIHSANELFATRKFPTVEIPFEPRKNKLFSDNFDRISDLKFPYMDPIKYVQANRYTVGAEQLRLMLLKLADSSWISYLNSINKIIANTEEMKKKFLNKNIIDEQKFFKAYLGEKYKLSEYAFGQGLGNEFSDSLLDGNYFDFEKDSIIKKQSYLTRITEQIEGVTKTQSKNIISRVQSDINQDLDILYTLQNQLKEAYKDRDEKYETVRDTIIKELEQKNKVIVISQFFTTAKYYKERLSQEEFFDEKIGLVVGNNTECVIGETPYTKNEILNRFAPRAKNKKEYIDSQEEINLIIGTDTISTGQNLQDATVILNLDLPYNPMILEQRIGRIDRPRAVKDVNSIYIYTFPIYEAIESELKMTERLGEKMKGVLSDTQFDNVVLPEYAGYLKKASSNSSKAIEQMLDETLEQNYYKNSVVSESHSDYYLKSNSRMMNFKQNPIQKSKNIKFDNISFSKGESASVAVVKMSYRDINNSELNTENRIINVSNKTNMLISEAENQLYNILSDGIDNSKYLTISKAESYVNSLTEIIDKLIPQYVEEYNNQLENVSEGVKRVENSTAKRAALLIRESAANDRNQTMIISKMQNADFEPKQLAKLVKGIELIDKDSPLFDTVRDISNDINKFWNNFEEYINIFRLYREELSAGRQKSTVNLRKANSETTSYQLLLANIVVDELL